MNEIKNIIGSLINKTANLDDVAGISITEIDDAELASVFSAAREILVEGLELDAQSLYNAIVAAYTDTVFFNTIDFQNWAKVKHNLFNTLKSFQNKALMSGLKKHVDTWSDFLQQDGINPIDALERIEKKCADLRAEYCGSLISNLEFLAEIAPRVEKIYDDIKENNNTLTVTTGFSSLDNEISGGYGRGDLIVINGFTGKGKSAFMLNSAVHQARAGFTIGIVSREMSSEENFIRIHTKTAADLLVENGRSKNEAVKRNEIQIGMNDYVYNILKQSLPHLKDYRIGIDSKTSDIYELKSQVKMWIDHFGLDAVYVDYMQLMNSRKNYGTDASRLEDISRTLKLIAMENRIPVIALSQYNEEAIKLQPHQRFEKQKGSSGIKQDASVILDVDFDNSEYAREYQATVTPRKNRNGPVHNPIPFTFTGGIFDFTENAN